MGSTRLGVLNLMRPPRLLADGNRRSSGNEAAKLVQTGLQTVTEIVCVMAFSEALSLCLYWLGRQDSNLRMTVPKTVALPLGDAPSMPRALIISLDGLGSLDGA